ncbi:hypothetical protein [Noviherbaspirillum sp.]|uniref:hypothetical protein n=1 Tax=Noviherbaspirillum sp. TaxID=1926288 RepID=UPI002B4629E8|nr:hypothetical protein [Noviherbaspirillum sp.]HJV82875.1 hypothetical protein [Noviherbaspirillum sp.]
MVTVDALSLPPPHALKTLAAINAAHSGRRYSRVCRVCLPEIVDVALRVRRVADVPCGTLSMFTLMDSSIGKYPSKFKQACCGSRRMTTANGIASGCMRQPMHTGGNKMMISGDSVAMRMVNETDPVIRP